MTKLPVLVGEFNPHSLRIRDALAPRPPGCAGWRLARMMGMNSAEYLAAFDRRNLLASATWSAPAARDAAADLEAEFPDRDLILLGAKVAAAFGLAGRTWERVRRPGPVPAHFLVLPHPSGRCRAWNEPHSGRLLIRLIAPYLPGGRSARSDS